MDAGSNDADDDDQDGDDNGIKRNGGSDAGAGNSKAPAKSLSEALLGDDTLSGQSDDDDDDDDDINNQAKPVPAPAPAPSLGGKHTGLVDAAAVASAAPTPSAAPRLPPVAVPAPAPAPVAIPKANDRLPAPRGAAAIFQVLTASSVRDAVCLGIDVALRASGYVAPSSCMSAQCAHLCCCGYQELMKHTEIIRKPKGEPIYVVWDFGAGSCTGFNLGMLG